MNEKARNLEAFNEAVRRAQEAFEDAMRDFDYMKRSGTTRTENNDARQVSPGGLTVVWTVNFEDMR